MTIRSLHVDTARSWRGGQNQVLLTVQGLESLGHPAVLVAHERGELKRRASEGLRFVGLAPKSEFDVAAGWQLARVVADVKPAVIHAHDPMGVSLSAMALQMQHDVTPRPVLVASRRVDFHLKRHAFSRWKYRQVTGFIAASNVIRRMLIDDGIPDEDVVIVHDGVNVSAIDKVPPADVRTTFWLPHGAPVVGNVAALVAHKGQKHLVGAAALVVRRLPDVRFVIMGDGELRPALARQIKDLGLDRHVLLAGFRDDALGLVKSLDLFVMSSVTEGLGSAVLEAMACERPVVGTRAGGIPELIEDGETGVLVPPQDEPAMAQAIERVIGDAELRGRLAAAGRARVVAEFSIDHLVQRTLEAYRRFLGRQ